MTPATRRGPRRDAQHNRERILAAAREVVAEHGVSAKMELDGLLPGGDALRSAAGDA